MPERFAEPARDAVGPERALPVLQFGQASPQPLLPKLCDRNAKRRLDRVRCTSDGEHIEVAQTIAMVVDRIGQDVRARGVQVHGAMAVAAAATLAGDIGINMAEAAGREPLKADQIVSVRADCPGEIRRRLPDFRPGRCSRAAARGRG